MTTRLADLCAWLESFAPTTLAEEWDNVGLLVGDERTNVTRVMTCLTVTPETAQEAIEEKAELIVTHHPMPFQPIKRLTRHSTPSRILLDLIRAGTAVYSPHTAFDSATAGINQSLAEGLGLENITPLIPDDEHQPLGSGRVGELPKPVSLDELAQRLGQFLNVGGMHQVLPATQVCRVAVACGSGGSFLNATIDAKCDALVTGEATFHTCLEAAANGLSMLLPGHYASERFAVEFLASQLAGDYPQLEVWPSRCESDPLKWHLTSREDA